MQLIDYLPILVVFVSALVGITGKTWNSEKFGLAKLTVKGRIVVAIACLSLGYGLFTVYNNHKQIDQKSQLALLANRQLLHGLEHILKPLCTTIDGETKYSIEQTFSHLRQPNNLDKKGHTRLVSAFGGSIIASTAQGYYEVDQIYQLYDLYIEIGTRLLNDTLTKYASVISIEDAIEVEKLLQDDFFSKNYRLSTKKSYFDLGLLDEKQANLNGDSPWLTVGLHWFNAVYVEGKTRSPNYGPVLLFLDKTQHAVTGVSRKVPGNQFAPCG